MKPIHIENVLILVNVILMLYLVYVLSNRTIETFYHEDPGGLDPSVPDFEPHNHIPLFGAPGSDPSLVPGIGDGADADSYPFLDLKDDGYPKQTRGNNVYIYKSQNLRIKVYCIGDDQTFAYLTKATDTERPNTVGLSVTNTFCGQVWNLKKEFSNTNTNTNTNTNWYITYADDSVLSNDEQCNNTGQSIQREGYCLQYNGGTCQGNNVSGATFDGIYCGNFTVKYCNIENPVSIDADGRFKIYKYPYYEEVEITDITTGLPPIINTNPIEIGTGTIYIIGLEITEADKACDGRRPHLSSPACQEGFVVDADIIPDPTADADSPTITIEYLRFYIEYENDDDNNDGKYALGYTNDPNNASHIEFEPY